MQPLQKENDSVAQLVEHYTFNVVVLGSNPSGITRFRIKKNKTLQSNDLQGFVFYRNSKITYKIENKLKMNVSAY